MQRLLKKEAQTPASRVFQRGIWFGGVTAPNTGMQSNNPFASSAAISKPGQTGAPATIKPQAGKPNLDVFSVGEFPPPAACNVVQSNVGPIPIGTYLEIRCGWSSGEASRLQAWILKRREVGNKEGLLSLLKTNPNEAMKYSVDLGYRMKLSWVLVQREILHAWQIACQMILLDGRQTPSFQWCSAGNTLVARTLVILMIAHALKCWWLLEQPKGSNLKVACCSYYIPDFSNLWGWKHSLEMGDYGAPSKKPTWLYCSDFSALGWAPKMCL